MSRVGSSIDAGLNSGNKMPQDLGLSNTTGDSTDKILTGLWEKGRKPVSNVSKGMKKHGAKRFACSVKGVLSLLYGLSTSVLLKLRVVPTSFCKMHFLQQHGQEPGKHTAIIPP